ncbi:hypothetical protein AAEX37_01026 [Oligella sp. MSHR50489EDL]|uniref:phage terminase small subunit n=1 Tax=Oligella sp. MSHR50489EDL TaxID=3139409 RepID=UPI003D817779
MTSPALLHYLKVTSAKEAALAADFETMDGFSNYELMLIKLNSDRRRLRDIQSMSRKAEVKKEILPDYDTYVEGVLSGGKGVQDEMIVQLLIWSLDADDLERALPMIEYAVAHNMALPDSYNRNLATAVVDEFVASVLRMHQATDSYPLNEIERIKALTADKDMPDEALAKLYKVAGEAHEAENLLDEALKNYVRAYELNSRVGVKTQMNRLKKELGV